MAALDTESKELENLFLSAAENLQFKHKSLSPDNLLYFYARYKQVHEGPCRTEKPSFWDLSAKQKWEAWKKLGNLSKVDAMREYVELMDKIDPDWCKSKKSTFGVSVSKMKNDDVFVADDAKTPFDWVKDNNLKNLKSKSDSFDVNMKDEDGLSLLHWACDRGFLPIVSYLIQNGAGINDKDYEGLTALHYACTCDHVDIVKYLLNHGADPNIKDSEGKKPEDNLSSEEIVKLLSNFK